MLDPKCDGESMHDRLRRALETAEQFGIPVHLAAWPAKRRPKLRGGYAHAKRTIYITPVVEHLGSLTCTVWHELGHAALGHAGPQDSEGERAADKWAITRMFTPEEVQRITTGDETVKELSLAFMVMNEHITRVREAFPLATERTTP